MFKIDENYSDYYDDTDDVRYPGGKAINSSSVDTTDGTPWLAKMFNNTIGWMQALYIKAFGSLTGISGDAENAQTSDVVRALDKIRGDNNAAERTISENTYFKKTGGVISGDTSVEGQLHVKGDLIVDGTGEEIISTELKVGADTITLREGNPIGLATRELAGVVTRNYDGQGNNNIIAIDADGNARVGDIDIATRLLYSSDGNNFFEDEALTVAATIGQDEVVRDTGNTTSGGVKIYEGTTFSNNNTQPMATREEESNMVDGYGVTWNANKKCLETTFIPSGAVIPQNIQADTTITGIVADKCVYITAANAITLTLANASQVGIKIRIINTTGLTHTLSLTSVSINVPHILPMANVEIMWNGTAWQNISGEAVGSTWVQRSQQESPFDVFPCSAWTELVNRNGAFERSENAPTTIYSLDGTTFYADVERERPIDITGLGTATDTGNTVYNSRGELMKIYAGSWSGGNVGIGSTGGASTATLSVANMPNHKHSVALGSLSGSINAGSISSAAKNWNGSQWADDGLAMDIYWGGNSGRDYSPLWHIGFATSGSGAGVVWNRGPYSGHVIPHWRNNNYCSGVLGSNNWGAEVLEGFAAEFNHRHDLSGIGVTINAGSSDTSKVGSGTAFDIVPPYIGTRIWKRTA